MNKLCWLALIGAVAVSSPAHAKHGKHGGWRVDMASAGGALLGQLAGASLGIGFGNLQMSGCRDNGNLGCEGSALAIAALGTIGAGIGGLVGAPLGHHLAGGGRPGAVFLYAGGATALGLGVAGVGVFANSPALVYGGAAVYFIGPPVAAGAGSYRVRRQERRVYLSPELGPNGLSLRVYGRF